MQPLGWLAITVTARTRDRKLRRRQEVEEETGSLGGNRKFRRRQEVEVETGSVLSYDLSSV